MVQLPKVRLAPREQANATTQQLQQRIPCSTNPQTLSVWGDHAQHRMGN